MGKKTHLCCRKWGIYMVLCKTKSPDRALGDIYKAGDKVESLPRRAKWDSP